MNRNFLITLLLLTMLLNLRGQSRDEIKKRAEEIKNYISNENIFFAPKITDREAWGKISKSAEINALIRNAEKLSKEPLPKLTEELYLDYSKTGNRTKWERIARLRNSRIKHFIIAECIENKGMYIKPLEELISEICSYKTWVRPAHDRNLENYYQSKIEIDLESAELAWELAIAVHLLREKLNLKLIKIVKENLYKRIFVPFKKMVNGEIRENHWMRGTNNWNAVCLAGVTGSALIMTDSKEEKAFFISAAESYIRNFIKGFSDDGYCTEGVGYWNYGFGNFILLSEMININTGGKVDLFNDDKIKKIIDYGFNIEITDGVSPAFADCSINDVPEPRIIYYLSKKLNVSVRKKENHSITLMNKLSQYALFFLFQKLDENRNFAVNKRPIRSFFNLHGVLISRNLDDIEKNLCAAFKGGNNDEHHNHNDVGSYVVTVGNEAVLADPGAEVYTARTFSDRRYESKVINSFGHPVPVVAGQLQKTGKNAKANIIKTDFSEEEDVFILDIKDAYPVTGLLKLEREFKFSRIGDRALTVTDNVEFKTPKSFETALITMGNYMVLDEYTLFVFNKDKAVLCRIECGNEKFLINSEIINEEVRAKTLPVRIGIKLAKPVKSASIKIQITPYITESNSLLINGDFEKLGFGWDMPRDGMGVITSDKSYSGKYSLKITDEENKKGSNVSSLKIYVNEKVKYELNGKYLVLNGEGLGIYARFFDKNDKLLNQRDEKDNISSLLTLNKDSEKWEDFNIKFETPENCKYLIIWLHSFNSAKINVYLDDINFKKK
ncbi:MAG: heparinase II/III family protein [Spirochaetes bacterium]|nr:heparinase II/III family protein [Spirochaetota bacterium]